MAIVALLTVGLAAPTASAHESYDIGDGEYTITVGDQSEPMYTYKWTNLDLIVRDSAGDPVALDEDEREALDASLEAPGGEMLEAPLDTQFGEEGRYAFPEGHFYTQPGQYTLHLDGEIRGVDATGTYDLPGPRQSYSEFGFPHEDVPTPIDLDERLQSIEDDGGDEQLDQRVQDLESQVASLEQQVADLEQRQDEQGNDAPGFGAAAALAAIAAVALLGVRRER